jgi:predicted acyl esterase
MRDGIVLRADVYRPIAEGQYPVILSHGIYAKGLAYQDGYPMQWPKMVADHPEVLEGAEEAHALLRKNALVGRAALLLG